MESDAQNAKAKVKKCGVSSLGQVEFDLLQAVGLEVNVASSKSSCPFLVGEMSLLVFQ